MSKPGQWRLWRWMCLGRRGVAAVEFALIMPILIVMFIGTVEILTLYREEGKLNALAFNVAEMVSVGPVNTVPSAAGATSLTDICNGAVMGLAPFPPSGLTLDIGSVTMAQGPSGLPNPATVTAKAYALTPAYDVWETTFSVAAGSTTCTNPGTGVTAMGAAPLISLATTNPPVTTGNGSGTTGQVEVPCDNMIVVKASITYPGLTGIVLHSHPVLTQTVYTRWRYASELQQLDCTGCTLTPPIPANLCNSTNTSTN